MFFSLLILSFVPFRSSRWRDDRVHFWHADTVAVERINISLEGDYPVGLFLSEGRPFASSSSGCR